MITSDLKGNHTYCKPKCKSKCQSFKLFHLHHSHCWVWAEESVSAPFPAPVFFCSLSSAIITSNYFHCPTLTLGLSRQYLWLWQGFDRTVTFKLKSVSESLHLCVPLYCQHVCFKVSAQWVTLTLVSVQWCWVWLWGFAITVLLRKGWDNAVTQTEVLSLLVILQSWCKRFLKWKTGL